MIPVIYFIEYVSRLATETSCRHHQYTDLLAHNTAQGGPYILAYEQGSWGFILVHTQGWI